MKYLSAALALHCLSIAQAVPSDWPSHYPDWWYEQGLIDVHAQAYGQIAAGDSSPNLAPLNQGQLLYMTTRAIAELDQKLAPIGGASFSMDDIRDSATPAYWAPVNQGQLKFVSSKFYDRFNQINFKPGLDDGSSISIAPATGYPWSANISPENMSPASVGQAKYLFSWNITSWIVADENPDDGIPDWRIAFAQSLDPDDDYDGDGASNQLELDYGTDPIDPTSIPILFVDVDGDSMDDKWELQWFLSTLLEGTEDTDSDGKSNAAEFAERTNPIDSQGPGLVQKYYYDEYGRLAIAYVADNTIVQAGYRLSGTLSLTQVKN